MNSQARFALIIPVYNEEECLPLLLKEYQEKLDERFIIAIGLNGSTDNSKSIALEHHCLVGETQNKGYGHGCMAAIDAVNHAIVDSTHDLSIQAYLFAAADGASDPRDLIRLANEHEQGHNFVIGQRLWAPKGWCQLSLQQKVGNIILGLWTSLLTLKPWSDLGPTRLIDKQLFETMNLQEWVWGWTIEAQIKAVHLKTTIKSLKVRERERLAGTQKISNRGVLHSLSIALEIMKAGYRSQFTHLSNCKKNHPNL